MIGVLDTMKNLLYALPIFLSASLAMADMGFGTCRIYFGNEADLPNEAREILPLAAGGGIRICISRDERQPTVYEVLSSVAAGALGTCRYTSHRVFQHIEQGKRAWTLTPPPDKDYLARVGVVMAVSPGKCPPQGDPAYISVENVSEGAFLEIVHFWERMAASHEAFDAAFAHFPMQEKSSDAYRAFDAAVKSREQRLNLELIMLVNQDSHRGGAHYKVHLRDLRGGWSLFIDFVNGRLSVLGLSSLTY